MELYVSIPLILLAVVLNILASRRAKFDAERLLKEPYVPLPDIIQRNCKAVHIHTPDYLLANHPTAYDINCKLYILFSIVR